MLYLGNLSRFRKKRRKMIAVGSTSRLVSSSCRPLFAERRTRYYSVKQVALESGSRRAAFKSDLLSFKSALLYFKSAVLSFKSALLSFKSTLYVSSPPAELRHEFESALSSPPPPDGTRRCF